MDQSYQPQVSTLASNWRQHLQSQQSQQSQISNTPSSRKAQIQAQAQTQTRPQSWSRNHENSANQSYHRDSTGYDSFNNLDNSLPNYESITKTTSTIPTPTSKTPASPHAEEPSKSYLLNQSFPSQYPTNTDSASTLLTSQLQTSPHSLSPSTSHTQMQSQIQSPSSLPRQAFHQSSLSSYPTEPMEPIETIQDQILTPIEITVSRSAQLESNDLDNYLLHIVMAQIKDIFKYCNPSFYISSLSELELLLKLVILRFTVLIDKATPGASIQKLILTDHVDAITLKTAPFSFIFNSCIKNISSFIYSIRKNIKSYSILRLCRSFYNFISTICQVLLDRLPSTAIEIRKNLIHVIKLISKNSIFQALQKIFSYFHPILSFFASMYDVENQYEFVSLMPSIGEGMGYLLQNQPQQSHKMSQIGKKISSFLLKHMTHIFSIFKKCISSISTWLFNTFSPSSILSSVVEGSRRVFIPRFNPNDLSTNPHRSSLSSPTLTNSTPFPDLHARPKLLSTRSKLLYILGYAFIPYFWQKFRVHMNIHSWGFHARTTWRRRVYDAANSIELSFRVISLANIFLFFSNGYYTSLLHRLLGIRYTLSSLDGVASISLEVMHQQLLWQVMLEFCFTVVPLIPFAKISRFIRRLYYFGTHRSAAGLSSNDLKLQNILHQATGGTIASNATLTHSLDDLDDKTNQSSSTNTKKEAEQYITSNERNHKCPICFSTNITQPYITDCGHVYCYYCLRATRMKSRNQFDCRECAAIVKKIGPYSIYSPFGGNK